MIKRLLISLLFIISCCLCWQQLAAQYTTISGTVYDQTAKHPLEAVAVLSTSGRGTLTDSMGRYSFTVREKDSIWFSLIGKSTMKYSVDTIKNRSGFDIMIHMYAVNLPDVKVRNRYYRSDSLQNRQDYSKVFNYKKPTIRFSKPNSYTPGGVTVGLDINEIINMFRVKRNRQLASLQKRLLEQEQDKYIDHRFSKLFVRKLTGLEMPELNRFMQMYKPNYETLLQLNDLELGYYIQQCFEAYKAYKIRFPDVADEKKTRIP